MPGARGRIVNLPLPPRSGDLAFAKIADQVLAPLVESLKPGLMLVSAGFDSHWDDPLAELGLSSAGYTPMRNAWLNSPTDVATGRSSSFWRAGTIRPISPAVWKPC